VAQITGILFTCTWGASGVASTTVSFHVAGATIIRVIGDCFSFDWLVTRHAFRFAVGKS
jgi:hypothetical protein